MWQKEQIQYFPNHYLANVKEEHLQSLPIDNIMMTERQLKLLIQASSFKPKNVLHDKDWNKIKQSGGEDWRVCLGILVSSLEDGTP